jgi:glycosyltransferase involved in cell wall biosynthesis
MGLAIVASRVGGNVDLVEPGTNGFLADPGDREAFSSGLRSLLSDRYALHNARQASRVLANRFDIKTVVDKYETIFGEIVS